MKSRSVYFLAPGKAEIRESEVPDPKENEVQIKSLANGICMWETSVFTGTEPMGFPCVLGHEGIGTVIKAGKNVAKLKEGDFVTCSSWSSILNVNPDSVAKFKKPVQNPEFYIAEPPSCVVTALYSYDITPGDRVLLMGAGFMGLLNVQGLAHCSISELVVTDIKPKNLELAKEFGATEVIQTGTPKGNARLEELKEQPFDLVIEASGAESAISMAGSLVRLGGRLSIFAWHHSPRSLNLGVWHLRGIKVLNSAPNIGTDHNTNSMQRAVYLLEKGVFDLHKLITHIHPVSKIQEAMELSAKRPDNYIKGVLIFD